MKLLIDVDVLETHESSYRLALKTGFGDPVVLVHKNRAQEATASLCATIKS